MKYAKNNTIKSLVIIGLFISAIFTLKCNSYDIQGLMNSSGGMNSNMNTGGNNGNTTNSRKVFVSSAVNTTALTTFNGVPTITCGGGGIMQLNCVCNYLATQNNVHSFPGSMYSAYFSVTGTDAACNILGGSGTQNACTAPNPSVSYIDMHGNTLFYSWNDLKNGIPPISAINITEMGTIYNGNVWTGGATFTSVANNCTDWGPTGPSLPLSAAIIGQSSSISNMWNNSGSIPACNTVSNPVYCFEHP